MNGPYEGAPRDSGRPPRDTGRAAGADQAPAGDILPVKASLRQPSTADTKNAPLIRTNLRPSTTPNEPATAPREKGRVHQNAYAEQAAQARLDADKAELPRVTHDTNGGADVRRGAKQTTYPTITDPEPTRTPSKPTADQNDDRDVRARPYAIVPETELQRILDELLPGEEMRFTYATEVSESFRDNPTAQDRPELAVYGVKDNDRSWYLGLKERPKEVVKNEAEEGELPLPSGTNLRKADDVGNSAKLINEVKRQMPNLSDKGAASLIGDVMSTLTEPPNIDPDLYEHEHELPTGVIADGYQPGLAVEVKSDKVKRVLAGAYEVGQQADAAQLATGKKTEALLVVYDRDQEAWRRQNGH